MMTVVSWQILTMHFFFHSTHVWEQEARYLKLVLYPESPSSSLGKHLWLNWFLSLAHYFINSQNTTVIDTLCPVFHKIKFAVRERLLSKAQVTVCHSDTGPTHLRCTRHCQQLTIWTTLEWHEHSNNCLPVCTSYGETSLNTKERNRAPNGNLPYVQLQDEVCLDLRNLE